MIYHYCNVKAFHSIVATKQIWLTDITKMNDRSEYKSGFEIIIDVLKSKGLANETILKEIHTKKLNINLILVGCFSQDGDAGSQFIQYADNTQGFSIGFHEKEMKQINLFNRFIEAGYQPIISRLEFHAVNYDKSVFEDEVRNLIEEIEYRNPILKYQQMAFGLRRLAASYKDKFFKDEREIRALVEIEPRSYLKIV